MDEYINVHPKIQRTNRLRFDNNQIEGTLKDLIVLAYEARDDAGYNKFRIFVSENGTPALEFYDSLVGTRFVTEEQEQHSWLSKLRRKYGKA